MSDNAESASRHQYNRQRHLWWRVVLLVTLCALPLIGIVAWYRSYTVGDMLQRYYRPSDLEIYSCEGLAAICWGSLESKNYPPHTGWYASFWPLRNESTHVSSDLTKATRHYAAGFGFERWIRQSTDLSADCFVIVLPHWFICLVLGLLPLQALMRLRRAIRHNRRVAQGLCIACGYDLRASFDRCPECGAAISLQRTPMVLKETLQIP